MSRQIYLNWPELVAVENLIDALWTAYNKDWAVFHKDQIIVVTSPPSGAIAWHPEGIALSLSATPSGVTDDIVELPDARIKAHDKETCPVCGQSTHVDSSDPDWRICNGCGANYPTTPVQNGG